MGALYWRAPTAAELAGTGLLPRHYKEPHVEVWTENWAAIDLYRAIHTQWRAGPCGVIGLDYTAVRGEIAARGLDPDDTMWRMRVIEDAVLSMNDEN